MASVSGLNDYDYQNLSTLSMGMKQLNQLVTTNKVPIPPEIMDHFKRKSNEFHHHLLPRLILPFTPFVDMKCNCMMGLFPEIGRAWLTIDSDIYVSQNAFCFPLIVVDFSLPVISRLPLRSGHTKRSATWRTTTA